ncbi:hypothetical protein D1155_02055 [Anaerotruncus sp. 80]|uniref:Type II secretion system protein GspF domain-containing protein n=1 Tax=Anaerotruncus colihominis TaxID=169435 RepID=A0A845QK23_9FIRM|nr:MULTISPECIES: type II secretion system F family protein [Anaerotruncus]NBH60458.1 hypothetical protein [Anaerotruncus colihominis]NCF01112.1 hypothetical protein [Anaerotruncus sp. 80]
MKYREKIEKLPIAVFCIENRKLVVLLFSAVVFLLTFQVIIEVRQVGYYVTGKNGQLTALRISDRQSGQSVPVVIEGEKDGVSTRIEVLLSFTDEKPAAKATQKKTSKEEVLKSELQALSEKLEEEEGELIALPAKLDDGTRIIWSKNRSPQFLLSLLLFPLALFALYRNQKEKEKAAQKRITDGIRRELPGFNNQLLLLLNSGLIFNDAFARIADGYAAGQRESPMGDLICRIKAASLETGSSLVTVMGQFGKKLQVREFSRMINIITDNQFKGVDLSDKLESERDLLWAQRKKLAEERGRAAETKMAFPLAILLLVLILITAAPAMLQM